MIILADQFGFKGRGSRGKKTGTYSKRNTTILIHRVRLSMLNASLLCRVLLEIHHIDENPSNNDPDNLLVLCANHHSRVTKGHINKLSCKELKTRISSNPQNSIDHEKIAKLVAEQMASMGNWPNPMPAQNDLENAAKAIEDSIGAATELAILSNDKLTIWIRGQVQTAKEMKELFLSVACLVCDLANTSTLEVGFTNSIEYVHSTGGPGAGRIRFAFKTSSVRQIANSKRIPPGFWESTTVIFVKDECNPLLPDMRIPVTELGV